MDSRRYKKTVFEYLHPVIKNGACKLLTVFEKENLEKQYFDEIKK